MTRPTPLLLVALLAGCGSGEASPASTETERSAAAPAPQEQAPPLDDGMSLQQLELALEDQEGRPFRLASLDGHPVLLTFFYSRCDTMCPLIVSDVRAVEAALPEEARAELRVAIVTIDPERDTAARLREVAGERGMPLDRWTLVRGSDADVRTLASTLGMNYRVTPDGFAHNAILTVLDAHGAVVAQTLGTNQPVEPLVEAITGIARPRS
jgi:protein SCO1/2